MNNVRAYEHGEEIPQSEIMDAVYDPQRSSPFVTGIRADGRQVIELEIAIQEPATPAFMALRLAQTAGCLRKGDYVEIDGLTIEVGDPLTVDDLGFGKKS